MIDLKLGLKTKSLLVATLTIALILGASAFTPASSKVLVHPTSSPTASPVGGHILPVNQFGVISQLLGVMLILSMIAGIIIFLAKKPIFRNY